MQRCCEEKKIIKLYMACLGQKFSMFSTYVPLAARLIWYPSYVSLLLCHTTHTSRYGGPSMFMSYLQFVSRIAFHVPDSFFHVYVYWPRVTTPCFCRDREMHEKHSEIWGKNWFAFHVASFTSPYQAITRVYYLSLKVGGSCFFCNIIKLAVLT